MALEDQDPRSLLDVAIKRVEELEDQLIQMRWKLKEAYDEGRKYPMDRTGSSFDRWFTNMMKER